MTSTPIRTPAPTLAADLRADVHCDGTTRSCYPAAPPGSADHGPKHRAGGVPATTGRSARDGQEQPAPAITPGRAQLRCLRPPGDPLPTPGSGSQSVPRWYVTAWVPTLRSCPWVIEGLVAPSMHPSRPAAFRGCLERPVTREGSGSVPAHRRRRRTCSARLNPDAPRTSSRHWASGDAGDRRGALRRGWQRCRRSSGSQAKPLAILVVVFAGRRANGIPTCSEQWLHRGGSIGLSMELALCNTFRWPHAIPVEDVVLEPVIARAWSEGSTLEADQRSLHDGWQGAARCWVPAPCGSREAPDRRPGSARRSSADAGDSDAGRIRVRDGHPEASSP